MRNAAPATADAGKYEPVVRADERARYVRNGEADKAYRPRERDGEAGHEGREDEDARRVAPTLTPRCAASSSPSVRRLSRPARPQRHAVSTTAAAPARSTAPRDTATVERLPMSHITMFWLLAISERYVSARTAAPQTALTMTPTRSSVPGRMCPLRRPAHRTIADAASEPANAAIARPENPSACRRRERREYCPAEGDVERRRQRAAAGHAEDVGVGERVAKERLERRAGRREAHADDAGEKHAPDPVRHDVADLGRDFHAHKRPARLDETEPRAADGDRRDRSREEKRGENVIAAANLAPLSSGALRQRRAAVGARLCRMERALERGEAIDEARTGNREKVRIDDLDAPGADCGDARVTLPELGTTARRSAARVSSSVRSIITSGLAAMTPSTSAA